MISLTIPIMIYLDIRYNCPSFQIHFIKVLALLYYCFLLFNLLLYYCFYSKSLLYRGYCRPNTLFVFDFLCNVIYLALLANYCSRNKCVICESVTLVICMQNNCSISAYFCLVIKTKLKLFLVTVKQ